MSDPHPSRRYDWSLWLVFASTLVVLIVLALGAALWLSRTSLLMAFAAVLFSQILTACANLIGRWVPLDRRVGVLVAGVVIFALLAGTGYLIGARVQSQFSELHTSLPSALQRLQDTLATWLPAVRAELPHGSDQQPRQILSDMLQQWSPSWSTAMSAGSVVFGTITGVIVAIVGAFYLALDPQTYRKGLVMLVPAEHQPIARRAVDQAGRALQSWLIAQLVSMIIVGGMLGFGAWMLGIPTALALGVFAGLAEFVPLLGAWIGALPIVIVAGAQGTNTLLWAVGLCLLVQQLESNLISPVLQQRFAGLPSFVLLFGVLAMTSIFGPLGLLLAAPLLLTFYTLIAELYVRDALGNPAKVPGDQASR